MDRPALPAISVVIPAHDEERLLPRGLEAIHRAAGHASGPVEVIVVANRCTDRTAEVARAAGAEVIDSPVRNIAAVRNAGAAVATGDVLVTVDADCVVHPRTFAEVERLLAAGLVGGGTKVVPERTSAGIRATYALVAVTALVTRLGGGLFWCRREDFDAIGGFDKSKLVAEDLDFARRLRAHGHRSGRPFTTITAAPLTASCRKFDRYGDWHMFAMATQLRQIRASARGTDTRWVDRYFFDFEDVPSPD